MLTLEMRAVDRKKIASFELKPGETLEGRVKEELAKAVENGSVSSHSTSPNIPPLAVFEDEEAGSIALFTMSGKEVTSYDATIKGEENAKGDMTYAVTGTKDGENSQLIGVFFDEDIARIVMGLWRAGVLG